MERKITKLRIGSRDWKIRRLPKVVDEDNEECDGTTDTETAVIEISTSQTTDDQKMTLLHEVLHAALHESGYSYVIDSEKIEEGLVRALSHMLWPLIKQRKF